MHSDFLFLFADSFFAALIFLFRSDIAFPALVAFGADSIIPAMCVTLTGATLGGCVNYALGRGVYGLGREKLENKHNHLARKYGAVLLLFCWQSLVGNPLTFIAGLLKIDFRLFLGLTILGRLGYYLIIWLV